MAPRPNFPFCPGAARPGRNQGAKHQAAPLACASGETGPTWIRDVAVEKGTEDRNETSRNSRMQVGPALPGAHKGEFSRQARPGRRGGKRVEARAASRNPESLTGRSPGRFGRSRRDGHGAPQGGRRFAVGSMPFPMGLSIGFPMPLPMALRIGKPIEG